MVQVVEIPPSEKKGTVSLTLTIQIYRKSHTNIKAWFEIVCNFSKVLFENSQKISSISYMKKSKFFMHLK